MIFLWSSNFYNNFSAKNRVQDLNLNRIKLKVNDAYKKDEKITTNFETSDKKYVVSKAYLDAKKSETGVVTYHQ